MNWGPRKSRYKCEFCNLKLENYHLWSQHLCQFHNVVFLQCEYCRLKFPSNSELQIHVRKKHTDGRNPRKECKHCPSTFLSTRGLEKHILRKHKPNQPKFTCKKCGNIYQSRDTYQKHLKLAHVPLTYVKCDKCPKLFYRNQTLKRHQEVEHSKYFERTQCTMCPASYKYREHLSKHMQEKHFSKPKFRACIPNVSLRVSDNKCNICSVLFENKATLLEHRKTVHHRRIDIFHCDECPAVFKIREAYENHSREEHGIRIDKLWNVDKKDYVCQDYVDFEYTMLQHSEIRQLMNIRKTRKFSQRIVIVTYDQENDKDDSDDDFDVDEDDLNNITTNVKTFFDTLLSQYRNEHNISEITNLPMQLYINDEDKLESHIKYIEIEISGQPENFTLDGENNISKDFGSQNVSNCGRSQYTDSISHTLEVPHDSTAEVSDLDVTLPINAFSCTKCSELFPTEELLLVHSTSVHKSTTTVPSLAKKYFNEKCKTTDVTHKSGDTHDLAELNGPVVSDARSKSITISNKKPKVVSRKKSCERYDIHRKKLATFKSIFFCNKCNSEYKTKVDFAKHKLEHSSLHECIQCNKSFKLKALLVRHLKFVHKTKSNIPIIQNVTETVDQESAKIETNGNLMFQCKDCQALFPCKELLLNHCMWEHTKVTSKK